MWKKQLNAFQIRRNINENKEEYYIYNPINTMAVFM